MKFTNEQIHHAIKRAATCVEFGGNYNFMSLDVEDHCGSPMCMWGWIGAELGFPVGTSIGRVADAVSRRDTDLYRCNDGHHWNPIYAADAMRKFADTSFPIAVPVIAPPPIRPADPAHALVPWDSCAWKPKRVAS
jgi:hypothetical protein